LLSPASRVSLRPALSSGAGRRVAAGVQMSLVSEAATLLSGAQAASVEKMKSVLEMSPKDYPAEQGFDTFSMEGQGTLTAFEAPGKNNVAWCSSLNVAGKAMALASLTTWCGPLADVPHLITRTVVTDLGVELYIDFRPRAYAAYETVQEDGDYGEPSSREWFGHKGARDGFAETFFTPEMEAWAAGIRAQGRPKPKASGDELLYRGPLTIDITLPATPENVAVAVSATSEAAGTWLGWMETTPPLPAGMKVTGTYAYDTKMRAQLFGVLANVYTGIFGAKGRLLAAADAGPLDEAYVGGAS